MNKADVDAVVSDAYKVYINSMALVINRWAEQHFYPWLKVNNYRYQSSIGEWWIIKGDDIVVVSTRCEFNSNVRVPEFILRFLNQECFPTKGPEGTDLLYGYLVDSYPKRD